MPRWREQLFVVLNRGAASASRFYHLPSRPGVRGRHPGRDLRSGGDRRLRHLRRRPSGDRGCAATSRSAARRGRHGGGFVWIGLHEPNRTSSTASPPRSTSTRSPSRTPSTPTSARSSSATATPCSWCSSRPATSTHDEVVEIGQIMVFVGRGLRGHRPPRRSRRAAPTCARELEDEPEQLPAARRRCSTPSPTSVVDDYDGGDARPRRTTSTRSSARSSPGRTAAHAERIFKLKREVLDFRRAVDPLRTPLAAARGRQRPARSTRPADVLPRRARPPAARRPSTVAELDELLDSALDANVAQVGMRQNEDMRKISAWVAIVAVPTMIAGIYGMNFEHMPELGSGPRVPAGARRDGGSCACLLYRNFKRRDWL